MYPFETWRINAVGKIERKCSLHTMARNESGAVLVLSLLVLSMLTLIGTAALTASSVETKISENYTKSIKSFYASVTGTEEAKARLKGFQDAANFIGDPDATPNPDWSAYLLTDATWTTSHDPNYDTHYENYFPTTANHVATAISANSLQTTNTYWVKLWYKREYDAEVAGHTDITPLYADQDGSTGTNTATSPGSIMFYGYKDIFSTTREEYTTPNDRSGSGAPIIFAKSYGYDGFATKSQTIIETALRRGVGPAGNQAIFGDHIDSSGTALNVNGNDQCECGWTADLCPDVYAFGWDSPVSDDPDLTGIPDITSTLGFDVYYAAQLDIDGMVDDIYVDRTIVVTQEAIQNTTYGSPTDYEVVYVNAIGINAGNEVVFNNVIGYGTLAVHGNLRLTGTLDWNGLIIATGDVVFQGGAMIDSKTVAGAVYAGEEASLNGTADVQFSACELAKARGAYSYTYAGWKDTSL